MNEQTRKGLKNTTTNKTTDVRFRFLTGQVGLADGDLKEIRVVLDGLRRRQRARDERTRRPSVTLALLHPLAHCGRGRRALCLLVGRPRLLARAVAEAHGLPQVSPRVQASWIDSFIHAFVHS